MFHVEMCVGLAAHTDPDLVIFAQGGKTWIWQPTAVFDTDAAADVEAFVRSVRERIENGLHALVPASTFVWCEPNPPMTTAHGWDTAVSGYQNIQFLLCEGVRGEPGPAVVRILCTITKEHKVLH